MHGVGPHGGLPRRSVLRFVNILVDTASRSHRNGGDGLRIGVVVLVGALHLEQVAVNDVLVLGMTDGPLHDIGAGEAAHIVLFLGSLQVVESVISGQGHGIGTNSHLLAGVLVAIDLELGAEVVEQGVGCGHIDCPGGRGSGRGRACDDIGVGKGFGLGVIRHSGEAVAGDTGLVDHIEIRRIELRCGDVVCALERA